MPSLSSFKERMQYFCLGKFDPASFPAKPLHDLIEESFSSTPHTISKGNFSGMFYFLLSTILIANHTFISHLLLVLLSDRLFYIYTSGTTGLPKAAIIKHSRYFWMGTAIKNLIGLRSNDVIYSSIPLYHLSGGTLGTCQCLIFGNTLAIRQKFSASQFWTDCIKYKCTVCFFAFSFCSGLICIVLNQAAQYIGEICRYVLAQKPQPTDTSHQVRIIFGNGLRPAIWSQFVQRFNIKQVGEFYGSTEGNANVGKLN